MLYSYRARNQAGQEINEVAEADNMEMLREAVKAKGLYLISSEMTKTDIPHGLNPISAKKANTAKLRELKQSIILISYLGKGLTSFGIFSVIYILIFSSATLSLVCACIIGILLGVVIMCIAALPYRLHSSRLKREGDCYEAEIINAQYVLMIPDRGKSLRDRRYITSLTVECIYTNFNGNRCIVKAKNYEVRWRYQDNLMHKPHVVSLAANVWVNPHDPSDYYIEVRYWAEMGIG